MEELPPTDDDGMGALFMDGNFDFDALAELDHEDDAPETRSPSDIDLVKTDQTADDQDMSFDYNEHTSLSLDDPESQDRLSVFIDDPVEPDLVPSDAVEEETMGASDAERALYDSPPKHSRLFGQAPLPTSILTVEIPSIASDVRDQYVEYWSGTVESVSKENVSKTNGEVRYVAHFEDGREAEMSFDELAEAPNGHSVLQDFFDSADMSLGVKRKYMGDDAYASQPEDGDSFGSHTEDEELPIEDEELSLPTRRSERRTLRTRPQRRSLFTERYGRNDDEDIDPLANSPPSVDDDFVPVVTSDVLPKRGRMKSRRQRKVTRVSKHRHEDSDIEFEPIRRSSRANKTAANMKDAMDFDDDDSFAIVEEKSAAVPKVISIREIFQPPSQAFANVHMPKCNTCGHGRGRGQLIHCQGCTFSYHKHCIGYRAGREHVVTKVGHEDFVLQCRYCIELPHKKDGSAPRHGICWECKEDGQSCNAFSLKRTSRQEEKLREENGGVDPITRVSPTLVNNPDSVLFRCVGCQRGWHLDHLPSARSQIQTVGTDLKAERLKDYAIDWHCNACNTQRHKIHRLVAWRPTDPALKGVAVDYDAVNEGDKDYLIKWETRSYAKCTWMPGAWLFGICSPTMRKSFQKKTYDQDLLQYTEKEAIPDEFLLADIIMNVKMSDLVSRDRSKKGDIANIDQVTRILVKFQGLGYDDVVWDAPPSPENHELYEAFVDAFHDFVEGKYFQSEANGKIRERVRQYQEEEFQEVDVQPPGLKRGRLMNYQLEGLNWLLGNYHAQRSVVLADEMGLGKTVQVVSLVTSLVQQKPKCWPFLIVVPNATCPNWRREFKQWAPDLRVVTYHGGKQSQELAYKYELFPGGSKEMKAHAVIMSYDSAADPHTYTLFRYVPWQGLVVDEGQRLKNDQNLLYLALRRMRIPFRLLLTGTPLQNNKRELFNLLQFIDTTQDAAKLDEEFAVLDKNSLPKLHEKIRPYFLRRTKAGVLKFLPPMAQIILPVTMTVIQERLSKSIMAKNPLLIKSMFARSKLKPKDRGSLNNILVQLRKCLCHPFMYSEAIEEKHHDQEVIFRNLVEASSKLMLLKVMLPRLKERGHRVLIFSQFLQQLDIMEDFLNGLGFGFRRLDGSMSSLEKQKRIDAYNAPNSELFAFLLSTRAGGVGINLATADTVIIMDPDFNPHQDIQALSRAHRIGQKNKVLCFQIVTKDSVEERIMQIGRKKMALDHALIESMDDEDLAGDDLESILKHGAQALFDEDYQKSAIVYDEAAVDKLLDRSQEEQTKTDEGGSAEAQFSYARVWANDKDGFDDKLGAVEEEAPEPINSSVWDSILAQREEEAKREQEALKESLGRGNRRRQAINYKTNTAAQIEGLGPVDDEGGASDSSDDFHQAESPEESEDEAGDPTKGSKRKKTSPKAAPSTSLKTPHKTHPVPQTTPRKQSKKQKNVSPNKTPQKRPQQQVSKSTGPGTSQDSAKAKIPGKTAVKSPCCKTPCSEGASTAKPPSPNQEDDRRDTSPASSPPPCGLNTPPASHHKPKEDRLLSTSIHPKSGTAGRETSTPAPTPEPTASTP